MDLRTLRTSHGWTQTRLAAHIGVTEPYISQVETGVRPLARERAVQICEAFGLSGDDLALTVGRLMMAPRPTRTVQ